MPRLYLVRHGQTAWNEAGRYQGRIDIPLDDVGRRQAAALRPRLDGVPFTAVYTSTLSRARETAVLLFAPRETDSFAREPAEVIALAAFDEMSYGHWEGHTGKEVTASFAEDWLLYQRDPGLGRPTGGESRAELQERVAVALHDLSRRHAPDSQVLLVTHGGTLRAIVTHVLGLDIHAYTRLRFDNASLSIVDLPVPAPGTPPADLRGVVLLLNDTAHLEPLKSTVELYARRQATPR